MKKKMPFKNIVLVLVPVLVAVCALVIFARLPKDEQYLLEGAVEIASTACYTKVGGTVETLLVQAGQQVHAGDVLAVIDDREVDDQLEQLLQVMEMKKAQAEQLKTPPDTEAQMASRRAAENNVALWKETLAQAKRDLTAANKDLDAQRQLYEAGVIAQSEFQKYEKAAELARSQVKTTEAQLSAAQNSVDAIPLPDVDSQAVAAAEADMELTEIQIRQLEESREDYQIRAASDGVVISTSVEAGCTVVPGQSVFRLSNGDLQYFVFYLPQEYLDQVAFGDELTLYFQGSVEAAAHGTVSYIDLQAVYPPEDYQNDGNRNKRSVKVKAELTDGGPFAVGQELVLRLAAVQE